MNSRFSDRKCHLIAYVALVIQAILLILQLSAGAAESAGSDRKEVEWTFATSESPNEIGEKLHALESEIIAKYHWQVQWQASDVTIEGKFFDARLRYENGSLLVQMQMEPALHVFKGTIRRAFEKELRKHLELL